MNKDIFSMCQKLNYLHVIKKVIKEDCRIRKSVKTGLNKLLTKTGHFYFALTLEKTK